MAGGGKIGKTKGKGGGKIEIKAALSIGENRLENISNVTSWGARLVLQHIKWWKPQNRDKPTKRNTDYCENRVACMHNMALNRRRNETNLFPREISLRGRPFGSRPNHCDC